MPCSHTFPASAKRIPSPQLQAFGGTEEAIAAIHAADGLSSLDTAIEHFMATRDPNSGTARAAVAQLNALHEAQSQAARDLENSGVLPRAVQHSDGGFTLYDTTTGEEIATAPDWESATRVATTHAGMVEERDSDRIAAVASAYQAAQFSGDWSKLTGSHTTTDLDLGTSETTRQAAARSEDHRQRVESQELLDGGDGSVTRSVLGESRTTFEEGQARTVNRILDGGSILTIFHEEAHGLRRRAHQNRSLSVADDIAILRAVDTVLAGKTTREGDKQLRLLPENFDSLSPKDQETAIDEGISRLMEAEVLRTRKGGGVRELPAGIISNNLAALSRLAGDKSVGKFRAFIRAVRAHFGLAIDRASEIHRGLEDGTISRADYESYLEKLHGLSARPKTPSESNSVLSEQSSFSLGSYREILHAPELNRPPSSYEYRPATFPIRDAESLESYSRQNGTRATDSYSQGLHDGSRAFRGVTALEIRTFRESATSPQHDSRRNAGFVHPDNPGVIFINADAPIPLNSILAHEWLHCLSHDPGKAHLILAFEGAISPHLDKNSVFQYGQRLLRLGYQQSQLKSELLGNLFSDALSPEPVYGTADVVVDRAAVLAAAEDLWNKANPISPSALGQSSDAELSTFVSTGGDATSEEYGLYDKKVAPATQRTDETSESPQSASQPGLASTAGQFLSEIKSTLPAAIKVGEDRSFSLGPAIPRLSEQHSRQVEDLAFENAKRTRIVNTDDIRSLIPGYTEADPLTRDRLFHATASDTTSRVLARMLAEPTVTGRVLIVAGGNGSGKSLTAAKYPSEADFIYDTTLSDPGYADLLHSQISASGREMEVVYLHRRFSGSFHNIIKRYFEEHLTGKSRIVSLSDSIEAYLGAGKTISGLKKVPITIIDNNGKLGESRIISLEDLRQQYYDRTHETGRDSRTEDAQTGSDGYSGTQRESSRERSPDRESNGRNQTQERLEAEGRAIIERYRSDGFLSNAEARAFGGGGDVAIDYLPTTGTAVDRGDPQGEIARLRGKQEHDDGRSTGTSEAQRILHEADSLVSWARENGRLIDPAKWEQHLESWSILASGSEHHVYLDKASGRVVKITQPPSYGAFGRSDSYLRILELNNSIFGDDIRLEGILTMDEGRQPSPAIVTSQPFTHGSSPTLEEIYNWMNSLGFEAQGRNVYINRALGIKVMDAHPGNIIKTRTGALIPIDLLIHELSR